jgi:hypothetical protein
MPASNRPMGFVVAKNPSCTSNPCSSNAVIVALLSIPATSRKPDVLKSHQEKETTGILKKHFIDEVISSLVEYVLLFKINYLIFFSNGGVLKNTPNTTKGT